MSYSPNYDLLGGEPLTNHATNQLNEKYSFKPAHLHNPQVPVGLSQLIHQCLAFQPKDRFPNMTIMNAKLHTLLGVQYQPIIQSPSTVAS